MRTSQRIVTLAAICMIATLAGAAQAEPLRLRYTIWVGHGPLFVAAEKGFFGSEGVEVDMIQIEDHTAALAALFAGQVDALATATQDVVAFNEPDEEALACVLMLDDSRGGDGILASKDIQTSATSRAGRSPSAIAASRSSILTSCSRKRA
jgi:NitT/TauT family transport system substrate-binding protein